MKQPPSYSRMDAEDDDSDAPIANGAVTPESRNPFVPENERPKGRSTPADSDKSDNDDDELKNDNGTGPRKRRRVTVSRVPAATMEINPPKQNRSQVRNRNPVINVCQRLRAVCRRA